MSHFEREWGKDPAKFFTHAIEIKYFEYIVLDDIIGGPAFSTRGLAIKPGEGNNSFLGNSVRSAEFINLQKQNHE